MLKAGRKHEHLSIAAESQIFTGGNYSFIIFTVLVNNSPRGSHWSSNSDAISPVGGSVVSQTDSVTVESGVNLNELVIWDQSPTVLFILDDSLNGDLSIF